MTLTKNREAKRGENKDTYLTRHKQEQGNNNTNQQENKQTKAKYDKDTLTRVFRNRIYKGGGSGGGRRVSVGEVSGGTQPPPLKGRNCGAPIVEANEKMKQLEKQEHSPLEGAEILAGLKQYFGYHINCGKV